MMLVGEREGRVRERHAPRRATRTRAMPRAALSRPYDPSVAKTSPVPRNVAFDKYWQFAAERHRSFQKRVSGEPGPWSDDEIIQTYKFCNVFRAADRVSQYLIREVAYHREPCSPQDRVFQIVAFRTFSKIETWQSVCSSLGRQSMLEDLGSGAFVRALDEARAENGGLYTGAFILCATDAYGQGLKHRNHVELFKEMFLINSLGDDVRRAGSLQTVVELLHAYPLMGDFMSYQIAIDLNYSTLIDFGENDFTQPAPGALRGIKKCFVSLGSYTPSEIIHWMVERQDQEFARLGLTFTGLWGRPLLAIDAQDLFCETDKYCRVALPELTSARSRIKSRFSPRADSIQLFFPPKWRINAAASAAA